MRKKGGITYETGTAFEDDTAFTWRSACRDSRGVYQLYVRGKEVIFMNGNVLAKAVERPEDIIPLCEEYRKLSEQIDRLSQTRDIIGDRIKSVLKDNETGFAGDYKVSWKNVSSARFDSTRFRTENPLLYSKYVTNSQYRRFSISREVRYGYE